MNSVKKVFTATVISGVLALNGCAVSDLSGDSYTRGEARIAQSIELGVVMASDPVVIEGNADGVLGSGSGALIGGIAARSIGGGSGSDISSVLGGIGGAIFGQKTEQRLTRKRGQEITVKTDSGEVIVVVQEVANGNFFQSGENVRLIQSGGVVRVRY